MTLDDIKKISSEYAEKHDCDVLYINSPMERSADASLSQKLQARKKRKKVLAILVTSGGDPDAAFRMSRALQIHYDEDFSVVIPGWCKSAGTLLAIGAKRLIFGPFGELGPLDVQMGKKDEMFGYTSGLDLQYGIRHIQNTGFAFFEDCMLKTMRRSRYQVTLKTAAEIAGNLAQSYISKMSEQISPMVVGETVRTMTIANAYGARLDEKFENLNDQDSLDQLVSGYPSHGFVIDYTEATKLFRRVCVAEGIIGDLVNALGQRFSFPLDESRNFIRFLNPELQYKTDDANDGESNETEPLQGCDESNAEGKFSERSVDSGIPEDGSQTDQPGTEEGNEPTDS